jgi:predicted ATPase
MRSDLPSGAVTFLFTDVEGSTKLLHELGAEGYADALAEHRRAIRQACAAEGGVEVDTQGDAFFFAFPTALGALTAASVFTDALASGPIQVRVGLHTGEPLLTEEGYVGDDVHFAARVASSAHGGQVILSAATAELVELELTLLGEHRLKDIPQAVSIYQLGGESFPPLKTISNTNLPRPASSFVGRERETAEVAALLRDSARLVTLTGPGGSGKTRLAIEAASELVPDFKAGVFWVGLAALRDAALVTETIAQTLGAKDGLSGHIGERELLLLLDNLEQVIEAALDLSELLTTCPNLVLLVTSRELLRIRGEVEYAVPPLAESEAVELFCARARLDADGTIAELCRRLDDMPLAVELAAARTSVLTPAQILERVSQRLDLLRGGRDADPRQHTLRATIEWSYELLTRAEQQLFARLSVFAGGCTLEAAEEVCGADLDTLQSLVDKSLLRFTEGRYWMLETIREYAAELLAVPSDAAELRQRHFAYFAALAEEARAGRGGDRREAWLETLEVERENLRAALSYPRDAGDVEDGLRLAEALWWFWLSRGPLSEGLGWLEPMVAAATGAPAALRALSLRHIAGFSIRLGDPARAYRAADASLALYRELGDEVEIAMALEEVGEAQSQLGDVSGATESFAEAADLLREHGTDLQIGRVLISMGYLQLTHGAIARAAELFEDGLERMRRAADPFEIAYALLNLGSARLALEDLRAAEPNLRESCALYRVAKEPIGYAYSIEALGVLASRMGDDDTAVALLGAADRMFTENGAVMQSFELDVHIDARTRLEERLGTEAFGVAWSRGGVLTDEAIGAIVDSMARSDTP